MYIVEWKIKLNFGGFVGDFEFCEVFDFNNESSGVCMFRSIILDGGILSDIF